MLWPASLTSEGLRGWKGTWRQGLLREAITLLPADTLYQLCPQAEAHTLPGLNHLFQHCTTGSPDEYIQIEETFAPEALRHILDFLLDPNLTPTNPH